MTALTDHVPAALALADRWIAATADGGSEAERRATGRLAALVSDPAGLDLALRFVDRVARPEDDRVAAAELATLGRLAGGARFVGRLDRTLLRLGGIAAPLTPGLVVPAARARLRQLVGHLVADTADLTRHIAQARAQGFRLNLNLLGEAVLGEAEADRRLAEIGRLVSRPDVDYVSVKVSAVASQLHPWDTDGSTERVVARLLPLYRTAAAHDTFLNLDMEEYHDLALTVAVFERLCAEADLHASPMGIVLQAYLPDASDALEEITEIARRRVAAGGSPVKVRLVKGANLAMEQVEAELRGWPQAPYPTKADVDAHYVRLLDRAVDPARTPAVRVGVASHHLFHVALAHVLAADRDVLDAVDVEMLQGMAPAQARAVRDTHGSVLLYTPVVARKDFDVAIAYLVRRLEENAAPQNFLHTLVGAGSPDGLAAQRERFAASVEQAATVSTDRRRVPRPEPRVPEPGFTNLPDTDPAVAEHRAWAAELLAHAPTTPLPTEASTVAEVDAAVARAVALADAWGAIPPADRAAALRRAAAELDRARGELVRAMAHEAGKPVAEADPEVSEGADFARYYAERAADLVDGHDPLAVFRPHGVSVVTPPWNFPVAIPIGSALAALAAGSPVILKPAPQTPRCAAVAAEAVRTALRDSGIDPDVLQVLRVPENEVGRHLITHPDVARVLLTGSIETARLFAGWRPSLDVYAETSGKNALIVTPAADVDLAVADAVRSAFGHAGQKCSAASLLILVGSAGRSDRLRRQLADSVTSLAVGPATDLSTAMGPLVEPAQGKLLRALTTLEPGEQWLVEPRRLDEEGRQWTPGVKHGVAPGSFFHTTECFGPVLGVMRVDTLDEAIELQNGTPFGLTGGLHSLDEAEIEHWLERVEVGNAYVNRHITGAIVQRQPFGGWKASVVGPGAKAGGPGYVAQLGTWHDAEHVPTEPDAWLAAAIADDARVATELFGPADPTGLRAEENTLRYLPVGHLWLRVGADARPEHVARVRAAAERYGVPVTTSSADTEPDDAFAARVRAGEVAGRVRVVGRVAGLREAAATRAGEVTVLDHPVLASGARELRTVLHEQAVSRTRHRFGHLDVT
ncbi:MAG: bifunctional proline dehydrogenase/L-glutamate gamma-semialdehyde dehydrogenase [Actinomycetales bacterium]|nr:bifunctional proline dehydrogenase/L-glutamate gamma-semialdehyde dehydrogenase [Actinomycetales bacterium]